MRKNSFSHEAPPTHTTVKQTSRPHQALFADKSAPTGYDGQLEEDGTVNIESAV